MFSTVDSGLANLICDRCSCTLFTLSSVSGNAKCVFISRLEGLQSSRQNRHCVGFAVPSVSGLFTLGWMCPLKREQPGTNGGVSYGSLTHSRLCCRDRENK